MTLRTKSGITIISLLFFVKFILNPIFEFQEELLDKINILSKSLSQKKAISKNEKQIKTLFKKAENIYNETKKIFVKDVEFLQIDVQKKIENFANSMKIKIKGVDWLYVSEDNNIVKAPIKVKCESEIEKIFDFIEAIENDNSFLFIDSLKIYSPQGTHVVNVEMEITSYGIKESLKK